MSGPTVDLGKLAEFVPPKDAFEKAAYSALSSLQHDVRQFARELHKAGHTELARDLQEIVGNNQTAVILGDFLP